jgi:hypothetical protein
MVPIARRRALPVLLALAVVTGLCGAASCADQGEGERCDPDSASDDCESGLVCTRTTNLVAVRAPLGSGLCCPPEGQAASVDACSRASSAFLGDAAAPVPRDAGVSDTGGDAGG